MSRPASSGFRLASSTHEAILVVALLGGLLGLALFGAAEAIDGYVTAAAHQVQLLSETLMPTRDPGPVYQQPDPANKIAPISPRLLEEVHSP